MYGYSYAEKKEISEQFKVLQQIENGEADNAFWVRHLDTLDIFFFRKKECV